MGARSSGFFLERPWKQPTEACPTDPESPPGWHSETRFQAATTQAPSRRWLAQLGTEESPGARWGLLCFSRQYFKRMWKAPGSLISLPEEARVTGRHSLDQHPPRLAPG